MTSLLPAPARGWSVVFILAVLIVAFTGHAAATEPNYNGHYEMTTDPKASRVFSLDIRQAGSRAQISFSAAMADGTGAAPDGEGKGHVEDGVLSFKFKDSFNNEGTCTLESKKDGFHLNIVVTKVVDAGPFHFYGNILLKKTSAKAE